MLEGINYWDELKDSPSAGCGAGGENDGMLSIKMNDDAATALRLVDGVLPVPPPGGLAAGLRRILRRGIVRRGQVLVWANSRGNTDGAPWIFHDLTGWECADSSFHIEDYVSVDVSDTGVNEDGVPIISEADQRTLLAHGLTLGIRFTRLVRGLNEPLGVRCIINANETCSTFRFHQIRPGESWNVPDLDEYKLDKMIVIDIEPPAKA